MRAKQIFEMDGRGFSSLEGFYEEVGRVLIPGVEWGRNLDALEDVLGGWGDAGGGFVIRWVHAGISRERLGYAETVRQLEMRLGRCDPSNRGDVERDLERARRGEGATVFEWVVEILGSHGDAGVELVLA